MQENPEAKMGRWLNGARELLDDVQSNMPKKKGIKRGKGGSRIEHSFNRREILDTAHEQEGRLESAIYQLTLYLSIDE